MDELETKLMNRRPEGLQNEIDGLKKKTEQNEEMARQAAETASHATDTDKVRLLTHSVCSLSVALRIDLT